MAEAAQKTAEEQLLEDAKASGGDSSAKKPEDDGDERTPEQKIIDDLNKKLEESNRRAENLEAQRDTERSQKDSARKEATTAVERQIAAEEEKLKTAVSGAKSTFESTRKDWREARDSGDSAKEEDALIKMNDAQMALRGAEFAEVRFKTWKESGAKAASSAQAEDLHDLRTGTGDVLKVPRSAIEWAKKHPKLSEDADYTDGVYDADMRAKRRGIEVYSPEYYTFIDNHLKKLGLDDAEVKDPPKKEDDTPKKEDAPKKKESNASSTAAPVGGSTGSGSGSGKKQSYTLSPAEREAAQFMWPDEYKKDQAATEAKYAKYQMQIKKDRAEGKT